MKIVCLGDSLTFGYGVPRKSCWTSLLENKENITVINKGINGDTSSGMLARFAADVLIHHPDMVCIMGGSNDIFTSGDCNQVKSNLAALTQEAMAASIRPILITGVPYVVEDVPNNWKRLVDFSNAVEQANQLNEWTKLYADIFSIQVIPLYDAFQEQCMHKYYLDGLHMNLEGHIFFAEYISKHLNF